MSKFDQVTVVVVNCGDENSYGGGKLGLYSYWDTCGQSSAPIMGINNNSTAPNQYEFYNYSPTPPAGGFNANPQELGNQYFDPANNTSGNLSAEGQLYYADFFNTGSNNGINVQNELYNLNTNAGNGNATQQVSLAIQIAFKNYIQYLACANNTTGSNGTHSVGCLSIGCGNYAP